MVASSIPYDAIILGAGGAGLMAAATAAQRGRRVLVIDHADEPGKKILISGGGRCNFTNVSAIATHAEERYLSANRHFAKSALGRYTPQDFIDLVSAHGIAFHEKTLGQLFCDGSAKQIVAMLLAECAKGASASGAVQFAYGAPITDVAHDGIQFRVTHGSSTSTALRLIVATGGPSIPKMGATGFAYDLARQFGLKVVEPRPALVPLTLGGEDILFRELSGVSADVIARCGKTAFREAALLTHKGLSGPAILQISSYWRHGQPVTLNLLPEHAPTAGSAPPSATQPRATLRTTLAATLPARLADVLADRLKRNRQPRRHPRPHPRRARGAARRLALHPQRQRRLCQGRSHAGRRQHCRAVATNAGGQARPRPPRHWRSRRRHRLARRLQFPMGLGEWHRCGGSRVAETRTLQRKPCSGINSSAAQAPPQPIAPQTHQAALFPPALHPSRTRDRSYPVNVRRKGDRS